MRKRRFLNFLLTVAILTIPIAVPLSAIRLSFLAEAQANRVVDISLLSTASALKVGDTFQVDISVAANGQPVMGVEAYVRFNPAVLEVTDSAPEAAGVQIKSGSTLPTILANKANNTDGTVNYTAGVLLSTPRENLPADTFVLATIVFKVKSAATTQLVVENAAEPRYTYVTYEETNVLRSVQGLAIVVGSAPAPGTQTVIPPPTTPPATTIVPSPKTTPAPSPSPTTPTTPPTTPSPTVTPAPTAPPQITVPVSPKPTLTPAVTPGTPATKPPTSAPAPSPSPSPVPPTTAEGVAWWIWVVVGVVVVGLVSFIVVKARR